MKEFTVSTSSHDQLIDITGQIDTIIPEDFEGVIQLYVPHTSAAINEGADPAVQTDVISFLHDIVPWDFPRFTHLEGNSAAHIKAILVGNSQAVLVEQGELQLGTWEKIFLCEFDGPRTRKVWVQFLSCRSYD